MNFKNKNILAIFLVILTVAFLYYYLSSVKTEKITPESVQMTEEQKLEVLSKMSNTSGNTISEAKKESILNQVPTRDKSTSTLSEEEVLQFLNKKN